MDDNQQIGQRILQVRKHLKLKQVPFGKPLGLGQSGVSQLEKGSVGINVGTFRALAKNYNVNLYYLVFGSPPMFRPYEPFGTETLLSMAAETKTEKSTDALRQTINTLLQEIGRIRDFGPEEFMLPEDSKEVGTVEKPGQPNESDAPEPS